MAHGGMILDRGVASLPYNDNYVGGGIVSFAEGGRKEDKSADSAKKYRESLDTDAYWKAMAEQTGPWANPLKFAIGEGLSAPTRTILGVPTSYITGLGWTRDEKGNLIRRSETEENKLQRHPFSEEARSARAQAAVDRDTGELESLRRRVEGARAAEETERTPAETGSEAPYYLSAPAEAPKYLRAPEEGPEMTPSKGIVEGQVPESGGLDMVAKLVAGLGAGKGATPTIPPMNLGGYRDVAAGEKLGPNDQPMQETVDRNKFFTERAAARKAAGIDDEAYMAKRQQAIDEQAKDLESTKTRAWALPLLQASLQLMGQPGSLGRGIGNVAPALGAGLEKGYAQVEEQKSLLRKSRDAMDEAKYALANNNYNAYEQKVNEAEQIRRVQVSKNLDTDNAAIMQSHKDEVEFLTSQANNARADARIGAQLAVQMYDTERKVQSQMDVLQATLSNDLLVAAVKAKDDSEYYKIAYDFAQSPAANQSIQELKKRDPDKSDIELRQLLVQKMVEDMTAYRGNVDILARMQKLKGQIPGLGGGSGTSGFSITPVPESTRVGGLDLGLGALSRR